MNKSLIGFITVAMTIATIAGCSDEKMALSQDSQAITEEYNNLKDDIEKLKIQINQINSDLAALQIIVAELQSNGSITNVEEIVVDGRTGYRITFTDGRTIEVFNGKDGRDGSNGQNGHTPIISVREGDDGVWYWTIDGEWLLDQNGERVAAVGRDGADGKDGNDGADGQNGQDGHSPVISVKEGEDGVWYWTIDGEWLLNLNGERIPAVGKNGNDGKDGEDGKDGQDGDSFFKSVDINDPLYVIFVLADGSSLRIARYLPVSITFSIDGDVTCIAAGERIGIRYELQNATEGTKVTASSDGKYVVEMNKEANGGTIYVTAPNPYSDGFVNVLLDNGAGNVSFYVINFVERSISFANGLYYVIDWEGGLLQVPLISNFDYRVETDGSDWVGVVSTKTTIQGTIVLNIGVNEGNTSRNAHLRVLPVDSNGGFYRDVTIHQLSKLGDVAMLAEGRSVNATLKTLANDYLYDWEKTDYKILHLHFVPSSDYSPQDGDIYADVASEMSEAPIYAVWDEVSGTMNIHTPKDTIYTNTSCDELFYNLKHLEDIDLTPSFNTRFATSMHGMFYCLDSLKTLDVSMFDVSTVRDFQFIFAGCLSLKSLDLTTFDVKVDDLNVDSMFENCRSLETIDMPNFAPRMTDCCSVFYGCESLKALDVSKWDTSECTYYNGTTSMFSKCRSLKELDVSNFDMRKVVTLAGMFAECDSLERIVLGDFETSSALVMNGLFFGCYSLTDIDLGKICTDNAEEISGMFSYCSKLTSIDLSRFNTKKAGSLAGMFYGCSSLETIIGLEDFDTSNVTSYEEMFSGCTNLGDIDISNFDTSKAKRLNAMFKGCESMTSIDISSFYTPFVINMGEMFSGCSNLTSIIFGEGFYTGYCENMIGMFAGCESLTSLDLSFFNTSEVRFIFNMFLDCHALESLNISTFDLGHVDDGDLGSFFAGCWNMRDLSFGGFYNWNINDGTIIELAKLSKSCTITCNAYTKTQFLSTDLVQEHPEWFTFNLIETGVLHN